MNFGKVLSLAALLLLLNIDFSNGEPVTLAVATVGAIGAISYFLAGGMCLVKECCTDKWVSTNFTGNKCVFQIF